jgi:hypothetical protein
MVWIGMNVALQAILSMSRDMNWKFLGPTPVEWQMHDVLRGPHAPKAGTLIGQSQ